MGNSRYEKTLELVYWKLMGNTSKVKWKHETLSFAQQELELNKDLN